MAFYGRHNGKYFILDPCSYYTAITLFHFTGVFWSNCRHSYSLVDSDFVPHLDVGFWKESLCKRWRRVNDIIIPREWVAPVSVGICDYIRLSKWKSSRWINQINQSLGNVPYRTAYCCLLKRNSTEKPTLVNHWKNCEAEHREKYRWYGGWMIAAHGVG